MRKRVVSLFLFLAVAGLAPARAAEVRGTVFDPKDTPLTRVDVIVSLGNGRTRVATTDAQGRYAITGLPAGRYTLIARKAGFTTQRQVVQIMGDAQTVGAYFRLTPWAEVPWCVHGEVLREDGKTPLAEARVHLTLESMPGRREDAGDLTTPETGAFAFAPLKPGAYRLSVSAPGYLPSDEVEFSLDAADNRRALDVTLALPAPETVPGIVSGQVLDAAGQPVRNKGVTVSLEGGAAATRLEWGEGLQRQEWGTTGEGGVQRLRLRGTVTTDAEGRFEFTLPPGPYSFRASAPGLMEQTLALNVPAGQRAEPSLFRLETAKESPAPPVTRAAPPKPGTLRGRILQPDGTPLANTGVYLFVAHAQDGNQHPWDDWEALSVESAYLVTDNAGQFGRAGLSPGRYLAAVKTRGFAESDIVPVDVPEGGERDLSVKLPGPALRASGRVLDAGGKPVAGARVFAYHVIGRWSDERFWDAIDNLWIGGRPGDGGPLPADTPPDQLKPGVIAGLLQHGVSYTLTDAEGRFSLGNLDRGAYCFGATAPECTKDGQDRVMLGANTAPPQLAFALARLGSVEGVVTRPDGTPLPGVEVELRSTLLAGDSRVTNGRTLATGAGGRYRLPGLTPGTYDLSVRMAGYRRVARQGVVIEAGKATGGIDFRLESGLALRGRVLRPDGKPAVGTEVRCQQQAGGETEQTAAVVGQDGSFTLKGLVTGQVQLAARLPGFPTARAGSAVPGAGEAPAVELRLQAGTMLRGVVRDDQGRPLPNVNVWHYQQSERGEGPQFPSDTSARTNAAGEYHFEGLAPGDVQISASGEGYVGEPLTRAIPAGTPEVVADLTLAREASMEGTLMRPDGKPAAGIEVSASYSKTVGELGRTIVTTIHTDPAGHYRIGRLLPGTYALRLRPAGFARIQREGITVAAGQKVEGIDLKLDEGLTLRGRVLMPDGTPAAQATVRGFQKGEGDNTPIPVPVNADGTFRMAGLSPGEVVLFGRAEGMTSSRATFTLPGDAGKPVELRLRAGAVLRGTVRDEQGKPLAGVSLSWYPTTAPDEQMAMTQEDYAARATQTDANGQYRFTGLLRIPLRVSASRTGYRPASQMHQPADAEGVLDLTLAVMRYGSARGRVLKPDGTPAVGLPVRASSGGGGDEQAITDAQGVFRLEKVPSGTIYLFFGDPAGRMYPKSVAIQPDQENVLPDHRLLAMGAIEGVVRGRERAPQGAHLWVIAFADPVGPDGRSVPPAGAVRLYLPGTRGEGAGAEALMGAARARPYSVLFMGGAGLGCAGYPVGTRLAFPFFATGPTQIGEDGKFQAESVPAGRCRVHPGWESGEQGAIIQAGVPVEVIAEKKATCEVAVQPGGTVAGQVKGIPEGQRIPVWAYRLDTLELAAMTMVRADGSFTLSGLAAGDYVANIWEPGLAGVRRPFSVRGGETTNLQLAVEKGVALKGRVEGARPEGLSVSVENEGGFGAAAVAADGSFTVERLLPGTYTLRLWAAGEEKIIDVPNVRVGDQGTEGVRAEWK